MSGPRSPLGAIIGRIAARDIDLSDALQWRLVHELGSACWLIREEVGEEESTKGCDGMHSGSFEIDGGTAAAAPQLIITSEL